MEIEITAEELGQLIRSARVLSPDFSERQFHSLCAAQGKLTDSGFLEAVWGMVHLQEEQGISCSEVLDANHALLKQKTKLENEVADIKEKLTQEQNKYNVAKTECQQLLNKINVANNELKVIHNDILKAQEYKSSFQKEVENENRQIEKDLEQCKKNAGVTAEDIVEASRLKAEVEKSGFNLETTLGLVQEFAPYQDAKDRLAGVLKTHQSITQSISALEEKERGISAAIDLILQRKSAEEGELKRLEESRRRLEISLSRLQDDLEGEQGLRQFYVRYSPLSNLLEYLASWRQIYFLRCDNPICDPFAGVTRFWTDKPVRKCPHCGLGMINPDPEPFRLLKMPQGTVFSLRLGQ
jgi:DNA repair exonuclease SbcCD ATPase subunit